MRPTAPPAALTADPPLRIVVMGVSGAGKSSVGGVLARLLALRFIDGDTLHTAASLDKLRQGRALDDADRWPWLDRVGACLSDTAESPGGTVVACSALRRAHRDRLRARVGDLRFVFLDVPVAVLQARVASRVGHPMPASLLPSQLHTLEPPAADECDVLRVAATDGPDAVAAAVVAAWNAADANRRHGTSPTIDNPPLGTTSVPDRCPDPSTD